MAKLAQLADFIAAADTYWQGQLDIGFFTGTVDSAGTSHIIDAALVTEWAIYAVEMIDGPAAGDIRVISTYPGTCVGGTGGGDRATCEGGGGTWNLTDITRIDVDSAFSATPQAGNTYTIVYANKSALSSQITSDLAATQSAFDSYVSGNINGEAQFQAIVGQLLGYISIKYNIGYDNAPPVGDAIPNDDIRNLFAAWSTVLPEYSDNIGTGNDVLTNFTGTLANTPTPLMVSVSAGGIVGLDDGSGNINGRGVTGTINYGSGAYDITFVTPPASAVSIDVTYSDFSNVFSLSDSSGTGTLSDGADLTSIETDITDGSDVYTNADSDAGRMYAFQTGGMIAAIEEKLSYQQAVEPDILTANINTKKFLKKRMYAEEVLETFSTWNIAGL